MPVMKEPSPYCNIILRIGLFQNIQEPTKALVFVFVLVDEQAMTQKSLLSRFLHVHPALHCRVIFSLFSFVIWKCVEAEGLWR